MVPVYGPNARYKIPLHSKFECRLFGLYSRFNPRTILVLQHNRRRKPLKTRKT